MIDGGRSRGGSLEEIAELRRQVEELRAVDRFSAKDWGEIR